MIDRKSLSLFSGILSEGELQSRFEVLVEQYAKTMQIEARLLVELFQTHILPAVLKDQKNRADALLAIQQLHLRSDSQLHSLKELSKALEEAICAIEEVDKIQKQTFDLGWEAKAKVFAELAFPKMEQARTYIDALELMTDGALWPFPKYRELLFSI
jgi:glutamine synthetase